MVVSVKIEVVLLFEFSLKEQSVSIKKGAREMAREVKDNSK